MTHRFFFIFDKSNVKIRWALGMYNETKVNNVLYVKSFQMLLQKPSYQSASGKEKYPRLSITQRHFKL
jgi:hypothetical protein